MKQSNSDLFERLKAAEANLELVNSDLVMERSNVAAAIRNANEHRARADDLERAQVEIVANSERKLGELKWMIEDYRSVIEQHKEVNREAIVENQRLQAEAKDAWDKKRKAEACFIEMERREAETRAQFAALKEHISNLERQNAEMQGYISRAQEDDIAREELVQTGDPDGDVTLVPKRRHQRFGPPAFPYRDAEMTGGFTEHWNGASRTAARKPRKHWVNYGDQS